MLVLGDILALATTIALAYVLRFVNPLFPYLGPTSTMTFYSPIAFLTIPLWLLIFASHGLYNVETLFGGVGEYSRAAQACAMGTLLLVVISFLHREASLDLSRVWLVYVWVLAVGLVVTTRFTERRFVYWLRKRGHLRRRVVILGANPDGKAVAEQLSSAPATGLDVVGLVGRRQSDTDRTGRVKVTAGMAAPFGRRKSDELAEQQSNGRFPILGAAEDLPELVTRYRIDEIIIAPTAIAREQLLDTYQAFGMSTTVRVRLSPGLFEMLTTGARIEEPGYVPLVSLNRLRITGVDAWIKQLLDYSLVLLSLPVLVVIIIVVSILIKLDSPGPIFHRRRVLGAGGHPFMAYKFRTMVANADEVLAQVLASNPTLRDEFERNQKLVNDPRVTRLGRFLRRTSLDELPQLMNVLLGQMSLVGPRMIVEDEIKRYGHWWMNLLTVKPGITGPWQVMGRNELPYEERVSLNMNYIRNYTIWTDIQILYQTVGIVLRGRGAF
jgi:lipopolysaccharide/colanic/teichoic acid biosynthesis glycosyltransferase